MLLLLLIRRPRNDPSFSLISDSVAQTATLTTFALFLSSGLTTVSGAPTFDIRKEMQNEPWSAACGRVVATTPGHTSERHSVHRTMKKVHTQFKLARYHFQKELKDVQRIYSNVSLICYIIDWLILETHKGYKVSAQTDWDKTWAFGRWQLLLFCLHHGTLLCSFLFFISSSFLPSGRPKCADSSFIEKEKKKSCNCGNSIRPVSNHTGSLVAGY